MIQLLEQYKPNDVSHASSFKQYEYNDKEFLSTLL